MLAHAMYHGSPAQAPSQQEVAMNRCHAPGHLAVTLAGLAGAALTFAAVPAALAATSPRRARLLSWADPPLPPGWNKHPRLPDPARVHAALAGGIPGWQLALMAVTIVLLVATLVAIANPGPGRTPTEKRRHRGNDDRIRRGADPQGQRAALAKSTPADQDH
jgi:hypothetical protein